MRVTDVPATFQFYFEIVGLLAGWFYWYDTMGTKSVLCYINIFYLLIQASNQMFPRQNRKWKKLQIQKQNQSNVYY